MSGVETDQFPILGQRLAVDVANSWYLHTNGIIDHLARPDLAVAYLQRLAWPDDVRPPRRLPPADHEALLAARNVIRRTLDAAVDETIPPRSDIRKLNDLARHAPLVVSLAWTTSEGPFRRRSVTAGGFQQRLGAVAVDTIELLVDQPTTPIRRCAHPTCWMLFCQDHHLRRFCSPGCSHRDRQHRYSRT